MASFVAGDRFLVETRAVLGGPVSIESAVMAASESVRSFVARANELAALCTAAKGCRDATAMAAIQTRIAAIDD